MTPSDRFIAQACDPRLAPLAFAAMPAWLWSGDGARILWCNVAGGAHFDAPSPAALMVQAHGASEDTGREVAAMFARLPMDGKPQLARLRSLASSRLGTPLMCACRRLRTVGGETAVLVTAAEPQMPALPLAERVGRALAGGSDLAAFDAEGALVFAGDAAAARLSGLTSLASLGVSPAEAPDGKVSTAGLTALGEAELYRLGEGDAAVTVARISAAAPAQEVAPPTMTAERGGQDAPPAGDVPAAPSPDRESVDIEPEGDGAGLDLTALEEVAARLIARRHPLRFVWRMEADGAFAIQEGEFTALAGEPTARMQGRPWQDVAAALHLDPQGCVARAIAARETWSGVTIEWPVEGADETLPVALSGLPALDAARTFRGYRGFGVCRDVDRIATAIAARRAQAGSGAARPESISVGSGGRSTEAKEDDRPADVFSFASPREARPALTLVPLAKNVVPLRAGITSELRTGLSPLEQTAFQEIARALGARLEGDGGRVAQAATPLPSKPEHESPAFDREPAVASIPERAILDRIPHAIVAYRADQMLFVNRALLDWTGMESMEAVAAAGGLDALFIDPAGPQAVDAEGRARALLLRRVDGQALAVEAQLFTLSIAGAPAAMLMLTRAEEKPPAPISRRDDAPSPNAGEVTLTKRVDEDLVRVKRQAEEAKTEASALLATISHEIRTPLNAIVGFAEIMADERLGPMGNDRYHSYARDIHASARQIVSLLDDMLDLSKIEAGRFDLSFAKVDLNEMMQQCVAIMQSQASRERIIIRSALAPALPCVLADATSVRQMLLNLLAHSIKFTGAGGQIILSTAVTDAGEAVLRVRDTGIGMSAEEIAAALEPFRKPQTDSRAGAAGEGLGLSLTKALAEANLAQFRIKSAINSGTLVEIVFPAERIVVS